MRRSFARIALAVVYGIVVLLAHAGYPWVATFAGVCLVSAHTHVSLTARGPVRIDIVVVYAALAGVAAAGVYGFMAHVLGPAYPAVRSIAKSATVPLAITFSFSLLARWDFHRAGAKTRPPVDPGPPVR